MIFHFLSLCVFISIQIIGWIIPLKDKKSITIPNAFQKILQESNCKPSKIWVDKGSEFYNRLMKSLLQDNGIELYSAHNEGKFVIAEIFIRTLKNKLHRYMSAISKNVYIDKLDNIVNKYNNVNHNTIKMKPVDLKSSKYIDFHEENNKKDPKARKYCTVDSCS